MIELYDEIVVRRALKRAIRAAGGVEAFAVKHAIPTAFDRIAAMEAGRECISEPVLKTLGYARVTRFRKVEAA